LDERINTVNGKTIALEAHHCGLRELARHETRGRGRLSILRRKGEGESKRFPMHGFRSIAQRYLRNQEDVTGASRGVEVPLSSF